MNMKKRIRNIRTVFYITEAEQALIEQKMAQIGTTNVSAYLRKMALQGYILKLDLPELKEMISLMRRMGNNLNQLAKRANENGRVYEVDLKDIHQQQEMLWKGLNNLLTRLGSLE